MGYAKEAVVSQLINLFLSLCCLGGTIWVYYEDKWANRNERAHINRFIAKGALIGVEDEEILFKALKRELKFLFVSVLLYSLVGVLSIIHFILCFAIRNMHYRQTFNILFHLGASLFVLIGTILFGISFGTNNDLMEEFFYDLVGNAVDKHGNRIRNPCHFPPPPFQGLKLGELECQERYTKVTIMCVASFNVFFYWVTAYIIGCFVEVDDSAELLYAELSSQLPPLRDISKLPPLPYYARPLKDSPTSKRKHKNLNRVEVTE